LGYQSHQQKAKYQYFRDLFCWCH